jgi:hypothetical protein
VPAKENKSKEEALAAKKAKPPVEAIKANTPVQVEK